jgi:hypothetical protein
MKKRISTEARLAMLGFVVAALSATTLTAQESSKAPAVANNTEATTTSPAAVQLSAGVRDVSKLAEAKVGDDTIIAFINHSGTTYSLNASEIIYLRGRGLSDGVITAMLNQRGKAPVAAAPVTTTSAAPAQSSTTYVAPAPTYAQPSTVYVASPAPTYVPYYSGYYYPYYYPYYGYSSPLSLSFGFGFGNYYGGGYHGGGGHGGHH